MSWPELDDVARSLEIAASEAPASPRAGVIRASLLGEVDRPRRNAFAPAILAVAAVVLLAAVVRVGTPVVGSFLEAATVAPAPAIVDSLGEPSSKMLGGLDGKDTPAVSASASAEVSPEALPSTTPVVVVPIATPTPAPSVAPTPTPGPGHVPIVLPTPPIPIPIPTLPAP